MSDSDGYVYDPDGICFDTIKQLKEVERGRIVEYVQRRPNARYHKGCSGIWTIPCDIALPCATQNEITEADARILVQNGCKAVAEGSNMPTDLAGTKVFIEAGVLFAPGKASNAGGVATSALEMTQNSMRLSWSFDEVDAKLHGIMNAVYDQCINAAEAYGCKGNLVAGANMAAFLKVANSMMAQGIV